MLGFTLFIIFGTQIRGQFSNESFLQRRYSIFQTSRMELVLVRHFAGIAQYIPDLYTAHQLSSSDHYKNISDSILMLLKRSSDIPSLIPTSETPDEKLRVIIDRVSAIAPSNLFIKETHFLPGN